MKNDWTMDYNYHAHTYLCGHATGTPEEYIQRAIEGGIKYMGFSDHIPHVKKDGTESTYRVPYDKAKEYVDDICALRDKYRDQIEIKVGFESEYYEDVFEDMLNAAICFGGEYLIFGAHFLVSSDTGYSLVPRDSVDFLNNYVSNVTKAIRSGVFTYVAHPDLVYFTGDTEIYREEMRKICRASAECNIPLEINFLGIRENKIYPSDVFWQIAGEEKSPVTFGFDSHSVEGACDKTSLIKAKEMVEKFHLQYIGKPKLIDIKKLK